MRFLLNNKIDELKRKSVVGQIVIVLVGLQLLFFASFTAIKLPTANHKNLVVFVQNNIFKVVHNIPINWQNQVTQHMPFVNEPKEKVRYSLYCPLLPVAVFVGYVAGAVLAMTAALFFLLLGIIGPLMGIFSFAGGGGWQYYHQPSFGYLLGVIVACFIAGYIGDMESRTSFKQLLIVVSSLLAAHLMGLAYLFGGCVLSWFSQSATFLKWDPWVFEEVRNLTWNPLPWDCLFSLFLIGIGFPFRFLVKTITSPHIGIKSVGQKKIEDLI